jgi:ubiquinone/menaquinone biosynthesis C-methylase UbiE
VAPQNVYDNPEFFAGYQRLRETGSGLNDVLEQPALRAMIPASLDGLRVLDVGCGFGDFARKARAFGASSVIGIDVSESMLSEASKKTDDPRVRYVRMSIEEMDLGDEKFDLVVSSLALHYVEDYRAALRRIAEVLNPGGRFVFSVEHPICTALEEQRWILDEDGKPLFWPIDNYRSEGPRHTKWFVENVVKYHRTVESYVQGLLDTGFSLEGLAEPEPTAESLSLNPGLLLHRRRPPFLLMAAIKQR